MRRAEVVALGAVQGPAELLPISSSGHVAALPVLLGWEHAGLTGSQRKEVEVALHAGGAVGLVVGLRRELMALPLDVAVLSMIPTVGLAFLAEQWIEERLGGPRSLAAGLVAGSLAMVLADRRPGARLEEDAGPLDGVLMGLAQACALAPGVSRAGATLAAARALGFARPDAVRLSRGIGVPVIVGAAALKGLRLVQRRPGRSELGTLALGAATAALATVASLPLARVLERDRPLAPWAAYRCGLAAVLLVRENRGR
jgi:undecaprenyl-diphosphatase